MTRNTPGNSALWHACGVIAVVVAFALPATAQYANVSATDIQRLQDQVYQASTDVGRLRSTDSTLATRLESDLDDLRDEVVYLKVKLRKQGTVSHAEYNDVRDRLDDVRSRARSQGGTNPYYEAAKK